MYKTLERYELRKLEGKLYYRGRDTDSCYRKFAELFPNLIPIGLAESGFTILPEYIEDYGADNDDWWYRPQRTPDSEEENDDL